MGEIQIANGRGYTPPNTAREVRYDLGHHNRNFNCTLVMIEDMCLSMANKLLKHSGMPSPNPTAAIRSEKKTKNLIYNQCGFKAYLLPEPIIYPVLGRCSLWPSQACLVLPSITYILALVFVAFFFHSRGLPTPCSANALNFIYRVSVFIFRYICDC